MARFSRDLNSSFGKKSTAYPLIEKVYKILGLFQVLAGFVLIGTLIKCCSSSLHSNKKKKQADEYKNFSSLDESSKRLLVINDGQNLNVNVNVDKKENEVSSLV